MPNSNNNKRAVVWVIVFIVIALLAAWWLLRQGSSNNTAAVGDLGVASSTSAVDSTGAEITVNDQFPGSIIFINSVTLPHSGWVVIRKNEKGNPGTIVGAGYFDAITHIGEVDLAQATVDGDQYFAILYRDNGDKHFSLGGDQPLLTSTGQSIQTTFSVTRNLPERKG